MEPMDDTPLGTEDNTPTHFTEAVIRRYLRLKTDPSELLDHMRITGLQEDLQEEADPVKRAKLRSELEAATAIDEDGIREQFIQAAKEWADLAGVTASALKEEGADIDDLIQAGFDIEKPEPKKVAKKATAKKAATKKASKKTAKKATAKKAEPKEAKSRVTAQDVVAQIRRSRKPFSMSDLMEGTGASNATVRKAINLALDDGEIEEAGERQKGRGRAAKLYTKVS